jgi:two-component system, OmpR family, phosphate regulon sensor histidine kinase PhoR
VNERAHPRRLIFLVLGTLLPGIAAGGVVAALGDMPGAVLAGAAASVVALLVSLASQSGAARALVRVEEAADARLRATGEDRDGALLEVQALAAAIEGMDEGMWITDAQGVVLRHNEALRTMLGTDQELVGQRPLFLLRRTELHDAVLQACREGVTSKVEVSLDAPGSKVLEVHVAPLGGSLPGSAAVFRDVTERKRLERVRQDFVANVSHELRTPIAAILGYAETLRSGALADATHAPQMVEIIHRQSERLGELVSDLLELSRLDAGERPLSAGPVSLQTVARQASDAMGPRAAGKHLELQLRVPESLTARADPKALEQVLLNLLDNAIKYTPEGGTVELVGERVGDRAHLSVRDTGLGIEAKHLPRLFERFYRADRGRSRDMGGTGLGLSIVRHLVHGMDGEVRVSSQLGVGSTFTVVLPTA